MMSERKHLRCEKKNIVAFPSTKRYAALYRPYTTLNSIPYISKFLRFLYYKDGHIAYQELVLLKLK